MNFRPVSRRYALLVIGLATVALAGCGRKASPKPPADADPLAPRVYPVDRRAPGQPPLPPPADQEPPQPPPFSDPFSPLLPPPPPGYR